MEESIFELMGVESAAAAVAVKHNCNHALVHNPFAWDDETEVETEVETEAKAEVEAE